MGDKDKIDIQVEIELEQELELPESGFKKSIDKVILTDKQKLEDSEKD